MPSAYPADNDQRGRAGDAAAVTVNGRRRRVVQCVVTEADAPMEAFYPTDMPSSVADRTTASMNYHVLARLEDDVKRAQMRESNPQSAIPSKGREYDEGACRIVEEYRARLQMPHDITTVAASLHSAPAAGGFLPAISPKSARSHPTSTFTTPLPSRTVSTATSPSTRQQENGQRRSARRRSPTSRTPKSEHRHRGSSRSLSKSPQPRVPANGRLQPLAEYPPTQGSDCRDDGRVLAGGQRSSKASKKLFLEPSSLENAGPVTNAATERQRRLQLADALALAMEAEDL